MAKFGCERNERSGFPRGSQSSPRQVEIREILQILGVARDPRMAENLLLDPRVLRFVGQLERWAEVNGRRRTSPEQK